MVHFELKGRFDLLFDDFLGIEDLAGEDFCISTIVIDVIIN